ncbi:aminotransferase class I/II-fold pyridoxal phosphate-dependent enzyme [bacterium]|nr:aminotransferase class I/II-fold pyridoxal phosphate-dependent enzyme [bacterium]
MKNAERIETKLIHSGEPSPRIKGAVVMPIFQSANYEYEGETDYNELKYIRLNNTPNATVLSEKLAALENAEKAIVTSSGMAAISTTFLTLLQNGDHLLAQNTLYGGTHTFVTRDFANFGFTYDFIDPARPETWKSKLTSRTKAIYVEAISNPLMSVPDLKAVSAFAKENKIVSVIDNTFASPINFRPAEHGFDLSVHSGTKYLNGHSDIVAGAVIGREDLVTKILHRLNHLGGSLDPHAAFLLHRGVKTLALRVRQQNQNAFKLAHFLERHPAVERVNYPGLETHPQHTLARDLFEGFGGMLSFELKDGARAADRFLERAQIPIYAASLGGVETLMTLPAKSSHAGLDPAERRALGISDGLIRISVGIEAIEDLLEDFKQALD